MAMSLADTESGTPMMEINTTPLIDVMLVLLVMLIITIPVMTQAVKLDMPRAPTKPSTEQPEVIDLEVDFDGTILWNGNPVNSFGELERFFRTEADKNPQPELHLRPHRRAKY